MSNKPVEKKVGDLRLISAFDLPPAMRAKVKERLRFKVTEAIVQSIMANPPDVDLKKCTVVLRPSDSIDNFDVERVSVNVSAQCETCCGVCETCCGGVRANFIDDILDIVSREKIER